MNTVRKFSKIIFDNLGVIAEISSFEPEGKVKEWHIILHVDSSHSECAVSCLKLAETKIIKEHYPSARVCARRYLMAEPEGHDFAIGQSPLDGSEVAEWLYLKDVDNDHNGYVHYFDMAMASSDMPDGSKCMMPVSEYQSYAVLEEYESKLKSRGLSISQDCIRTWFFVHDIDNNYAGLVKARRENFIDEGLTPKTHYIASTGICGTPSMKGAIVQMDAWAVKGLSSGQVSYLKALTHLNPTYEYGVTFERGTKIRYGDRSHIIISGTASIDNKGEVLHVGDVKAQTLRMWENVEALLSEGGAGFKDIMHILVYLRNASDYSSVNTMFAEKFPDTPYVIVLAPVCRPTWLIEMECIAVISSENPAFGDM